jgi:hypothetical protein
VQPAGIEPATPGSHQAFEMATPADRLRLALLAGDQASISVDTAETLPGRWVLRRVGSNDLASVDNTSVKDRRDHEPEQDQQRGDKSDQRGGATPPAEHDHRRHEDTREEQHRATAIRVEEGLNDHVREHHRVPDRMAFVRSDAWPRGRVDDICYAGAVLECPRQESNLRHPV